MKNIFIQKVQGKLSILYKHPFYSIIQFISCLPIKIQQKHRDASKEKQQQAKKKLHFKILKKIYIYIFPMFFDIYSPYFMYQIKLV